MADEAALIELATLYYSCRDSDALLRTFAARMGRTLGAGAVLVWLRRDGQGLACRTRWFDGEQKIEPAEEPANAGPLVAAMEGRETVHLPAGMLDPGELAHLSAPSRRWVRAALSTDRTGGRRTVLTGPQPIPGQENC